MAAALLSGACTGSPAEETLPARRTAVPATEPLPTAAPPATAALATVPPASDCTPGGEDAWYAGFVRAYNERDLDRLARLLPFAESFVDPLAATSGQVAFRDIDSWTSAVWATGDELTLVGYEGGGRHSIVVTRTPMAPAVGTLEAVFEFMGDGCAVTAVAGTALIGRASPCAFYAAVPSALGAGVPAPPGCADGRGDRARIGHSAVWTGDELVVLGGSPGSVAFTAIDGFRLADGWQAVPPSPLQDVLGGAVWTGTRLLVWGGRPVLLSTVDLATGRWSRLAQPDGPPAVAGESVWTGEELVVWGSDPNHGRTSAWAYRPATDAWRPMAAGPLSPRSGHTMVWTGSEVLVWGGTNGRGHADGAAYDPAGDSWRRLAPSGLEGRAGHTAVWTGAEMVVFGGAGLLGERAGGAAYDPASDSWRVPAPGPLFGRQGHTATWTGAEMIVYGGFDGRQALGDGAAYDPAADTWRPLAPGPLPARCRHTATWTGAELIVFGGYAGCGDPGRPAFGDGARYDPATDTWTLLPGGPTIPAGGE